jgi:membrane peptidoglycan carboxypeptidase
VRFYEHDGIDGIRVIGAVLTDIREGRAAEGASTITQQLARVSFLSRDKTLRRKVREAILAQRIEKLYSKDDILEIYLNKVYFGDGLYGAEAASRGYFGKPATDLTVAEAPCSRASSDRRRRPIPRSISGAPRNVATSS